MSGDWVWCEIFHLEAGKQAGLGVKMRPAMDQFTTTIGSFRLKLSFLGKLYGFFLLLIDRRTDSPIEMRGRI